MNKGEWIAKFKEDLAAAKKELNEVEYNELLDEVSSMVHHDDEKAAEAKGE